MKDYTDKEVGRATPKVLSTMLRLLNTKSELARFNAAKYLSDCAVQPSPLLFHLK